MTTFGSLFVPEPLREAVSDGAWLEAMLDAERALANASALTGVLGPAEAAAVAEACDPALYDIDALAADGRAVGNPVEPLVRALRERAPAAHRGATSQDILDTAAMLVASRAFELILDDLHGARDACTELARAHRSTPMSARTLLQQAVPTTFGYKAAVWLVGALDARDALRALVDRLPAQLGGAAGTLASYGDAGPELLRLFAEELNLRAPDVPWHTIRTPIAELAGALGLAAGVAAKIASDVILLAQSEVGEVAEGEGGGSSTMPQKRNPARAVVAVACERHARASCGVLLESVVAEHERAAGSWHAEWHALTQALAAAGGAVAASADSLEALEVDGERMRRNLSDDTLAEARALGRDVAAPDEYLGAVSVLIDRALARHRG